MNGFILSAPLKLISVIISIFTERSQRDPEYKIENGIRYGRWPAAGENEWERIKEGTNCKMNGICYAPLE
jgi:hypothetical protein